MSYETLTIIERVVLRDCARFTPGRYIFKPGIMRQLAAMGGVEEVANIHTSTIPGVSQMTAYALTDAGRKALAEMTF